MGNPAHQRSRHLGPGDKLGKYELIRQIAVGGMAELYLARTTGIEGFEKLVVVKRILPQYVANASFVEMFLNEARLAATLHHPNVAQVYDIGLDHDDYFFAMEYVHGEDLLRMASVANEQGVPISMDAALTLAAGLCAGLHYAHEKVGADGKPLQIVHRDVSPSNVIVSYDGAVKLVDFGIARAATRQTTSTGLKGKVAYMSPEQCRSVATLDRRSDIYAVGCVLYELTTGRGPFEGTSEYAVMTQIVNEDVPPPSRFVPEYPAALEKILLRALARDPAERYPTALQLQGHLEDFAHESRLRVSPLVLGRLMETLFPERLEEWAQAKSQGAFFVEQHVVRTLIEAGKTPDPVDQKLRVERAAAEARRVAQQVAPPGDDDTTAVSSIGEVSGTGESTAIGPPPAMTEDSGRVPEPVPGSGYSEPAAPPPPRASSPAVARIATPPPGTMRATTPPPPTVVPGMPGAVPILASSPGTMFPAPHSVPVRMPQPEPTLRVRLPRAASPTSYVRPARRRAALYALVGALVIAGGITAVIAMRDTPAQTAQAPAAAAAPTPTPTPPPAPPPPAPPPVVAPAPPPAPEPAPPEPAPEPRPAKVAEPVKHPAPVRHVVHAAPKSAAKQPAEPKEPKEQPWNADSPFMPVRTDKH